MIETPTGLRKPTTLEAIGLFMLSLFINATGNGLTVAANMGSGIWTASAANIALIFHADISFVLIIYGIIQILINIALMKRLDIQMVLGNLVFICFFGPFVSLFTHLFLKLGILHLPLLAIIALDLFGIMLIGVAISIYQRLNIILHPVDEMTNILRFQYLRGNSNLAQWVNFLIPTVIIVILFLVYGEIVAVNIGTLCSILFQGMIIGTSDQLIFPRLKHRI